MTIRPPIIERPIFQTPSYGIRVAIYPSSDPTFDLELARSGASSAGSTYQTIARLGVINGQGIPQYVDRTGNDGFKRFYKARSVRDGWTPSPYTSIVSATPGLLQEQMALAPAFTAMPAVVSPRITPTTDSPGAPSYGAGNSAQNYITRFWTPFLLDSHSTETTIRLTAGGILVSRPTVTGTKTTTWQFFTLPPGTLLKTLQVFMARKGAASTATVNFYHLSAGALPGAFATITATAGVSLFGPPSVVVSTSALGKESGLNMFAARINLLSSAGATTNASYLGLTLQYRRYTLADTF